jgi:hypothetical protein
MGNFAMDITGATVSVDGFFRRGGAISAAAITGGSARFDFTQGQPTIVDNQTSLCTGATTVRYDFTSGQPTQVFDVRCQHS